MDAVTAFLNNSIDNKVYIELLPGWKEKSIIYDKEHMYKLLKALYGLKQVPHLWQAKLAKALKELGFEPLIVDNYNVSRGVMRLVA